MATLLGKIIQRLEARPSAPSWITPSLVACAYPKTEDALAALAAEGISLLVNLHARPHPASQLEAHGLTEIHLPTRDFTAPKLADITTGIAALENAFSSGRKAAVHCGAGLGRAGTLVACYLVHTGLSADAAIEAVRQKRPGSVETSGQEKLVHQYHETVAD